jgi:hypothetical protein
MTFLIISHIKWQLKCNAEPSFFLKVLFRLDIMSRTNCLNSEITVPLLLVPMLQFIFKLKPLHPYSHGRYYNQMLEKLLASGV